MEEEPTPAVGACVGRGLRAGPSRGWSFLWEWRLVGGAWGRSLSRQLSSAGAGPGAEEGAVGWSVRAEGRGTGLCWLAGGGGAWRRGTVGWSVRAEGRGAGVPLVGWRRGAWRGGAVGWSWCAGAIAGRGGGGGMALLLCLSLTVALARGCLHCHSNFSDKFNFYRDHVNLKSWWVGDIPVSGSLLTDWSQDTMNELHLAIPAEISECRSPAPHPRPGQTPAQPARSPASSARSAGEAGPGGERCVPEDGCAVPGEDVFPG